MLRGKHKLRSVRRVLRSLLVPMIKARENCTMKSFPSPVLFIEHYLDDHFEDKMGRICSIHCSDEKSV
jgi:hypothetical protein